MDKKVFDGNEFALLREKLLKEKIEKLEESLSLVSLYFGEDPGSIRYTNVKQKAAKRLGIEFHTEELEFDASPGSVGKIIRHYVRDVGVQGVMIQKPAKGVVIEAVDVSDGGFERWWERMVLEIDPILDVDCLHPVNLDRVYRGKWEIVPATVRAVLSIIQMTGIVLVNKRAAVVGRSQIVGKPLAHVLAQKGAEVYLCASTGLSAKSIGWQFSDDVEPQDLKQVVSQADLVVSATGKPGLITKDMVKKGAGVVDCGSPLGDVDFAQVKRKASFITPVPGGVGPATVVSLFENLLEIA